jgi:hypothetical protein
MTERELFSLVKKLIPDLKETSTYSYRDGYSNDLKLTIELKCRRRHYDYLLIEKSKYDKLLQNKRMRYINSTPIGVFSFNLNKIEEPNWWVEEMPASTDFDRSQRINKEVGYLNIKDAKNITNILQYQYK